MQRTTSDKRITPHILQIMVALGVKVHWGHEQHIKAVCHAVVQVADALDGCPAELCTVQRVWVECVHCQNIPTEHMDAKSDGNGQLVKSELNDLQTHNFPLHFTSSYADVETPPKRLSLPDESTNTTSKFALKASKEGCKIGNVKKTKLAATKQFSLIKDI